MMKEVRKSGFHAFLSKTDSVQMHMHDFFEFGYVCSGSAVTAIGNGVKAQINVGDYYIIERGTRHSYRAIVPGKLAVYNIGFLEPIFDLPMSEVKNLNELIRLTFSKSCRGKSVMNITNTIFHDENGRIKMIVDAINAEYEKKAFGYIENIKNLILLLLSETVRKTDVTEKDPKTIGIVSQITDIIERDSQKPLKLSDISRELGYDPSYMCRIFKKVTGTTFSKYLQKTRISKSCRLLSSTDKNVNVIAELVGYSDIKFFNMLFKKYTGKTPVEYRSRPK